MNLRKRVEIILANDALDEDDYPEDTCKAEEIEKVFQNYSFTETENLIIKLLIEKRRTDDYETVARVIWGMCLDKKQFTNPNKIIALIYLRLPNDEGSCESNLAWSIVSVMKRIDYLSEYEPLEDPEVQKEIKKLGLT